MTVTEQISAAKKSLLEKGLAELEARIANFSPEPDSVPAATATGRLKRLKLMTEILKDLREISKDQGY